MKTLTIIFLICCVQINFVLTHHMNGFARKVTHSQGEDCHRQCIENDKRICYFKFVLEYYNAMGPACGKCADGEMKDCFNLHCLTADGVEKGVMSINRKIPGPEIHVCKDDWIVVDVTNSMAGTATTIHWHGIHQRETPYMDGTGYITQCPIAFGTTFRYQFRASEPGTHFYHSHAGHHKVNGLYGALIVREHDDHHSKLYDVDLKQHTMVISDWMHYTAEMFAIGLPTREPGPLPVNALINGRGTFFDKTKGELTKSPLQVYRVESGRKYRFRLIDSAALECPLQIQVQAHNLTVIATDGKAIEPVTIDTLITAAGERYDFIIETNQTSGVYCIKVKLLGECNENGGIEQYAVLSYVNTSDENRDEYAQYAISHCRSTGNEIIGNLFLNHPNKTCNDPTNKHFCPTDMTSINVDKSLLTANVDERFYLGFDNYNVPNDQIFQENYYTHFLSEGGSELIQAAVNNISFMSPSFSILTQTDQLTDDMFCNKSSLPKHCANRVICPCTHRIKINLNSVVELVLVDDREEIGPENHPFHIHGYAFTVTEMGQGSDQRMTISEYKRLKRENRLPVKVSKSDGLLKDTVNIPSNGYTVVRFRADNPGFWLLHCHFEWHMNMGMTLVLQVGEPTDFAKAPKNFPTCGDYVPDVESN